MSLSALGDYVTFRCSPFYHGVGCKPSRSCLTSGGELPASQCPIQTHSILLRELQLLADVCKHPDATYGPRPVAPSGGGGGGSRSAPGRLGHMHVYALGSRYTLGTLGTPRRPSVRLGHHRYVPGCHPDTLGCLRSAHLRTPSVRLGHPRYASDALGTPRTPSVRLGHPRYASDTLGTPRTPSVRLGHPRYASDTLGTPRTPSVRLGRTRYASDTLGTPRTPSVRLGHPRYPLLSGPPITSGPEVSQPLLSVKPREVATLDPVQVYDGIAVRVTTTSAGLSRSDQVDLAPISF